MVALPSIIIPLYIYPTVTTPWTTYFNAISANPTVTFDVIINPESGPGPNAFPDVPDYVNAIATMKSFPNTNLHGYVKTGYTTKPLAIVTAELATYGNWATYTDADITLTGVFFDEAPAVYNAEYYSYMATITALAASDGMTASIFNPGTVADSSYYELADTIVAFEGATSDWSDSVLSGVPTEYIGQTAAIMYSFSGTDAQLEELVEGAAGTGINGIFVTTVDGYESISSLWAEFVGDVAALDS